MIYATFTKFRLNPKIASETLQRLQLVMKRQQLPGMLELAFYTSADPAANEAYSLSFWLRLEDMLRARQILLSQLLADPAGGQDEVWLETHSFRLVWEQQNLSQPVIASTLRLLTFPPDYSEERLMRMVDHLRQTRHRTEGIRGGWIGRSLEDNRQLLVRTDWVSVEAFEQLVKSGFHQNMQTFFTHNGITSEFASSRLEIILIQEDYSVELTKAASGPVLPATNPEIL